MIAMLLPLFAWLLGKNKQRNTVLNLVSEQIKTNDLLIEAVRGLVRIQENNLKIMQMKYGIYQPPQKES